jgi:hypothetical protein
MLLGGESRGVGYFRPLLAKSNCLPLQPSAAFFHDNLLLISLDVDFLSSVVVIIIRRLQGNRCVTVTLVPPWQDRASLISMRYTESTPYSHHEPVIKPRIPVQAGRGQVGDESVCHQKSSQSPEVRW